MLDWFLRRGENRSTRRKTSQSRVENQQQTQPTYDVASRIWTRATLMGGEWSNHYAIPAPLYWLLKQNPCITSVSLEITLTFSIRFFCWKPQTANCCLLLGWLLFLGIGKHDKLKIKSNNIFLSHDYFQDWFVLKWQASTHCKPLNESRGALVHLFLT